MGRVTSDQLLYECTSTLNNSGGEADRQRANSYLHQQGRRAPPWVLGAQGPVLALRRPVRGGRRDREGVADWAAACVEMFRFKPQASSLKASSPCPATLILSPASTTSGYSCWPLFLGIGWLPLSRRDSLDVSRLRVLGGPSSGPGVGTGGAGRKRDPAHPNGPPRRLPLTVVRSMAVQTGPGDLAKPGLDGRTPGAARRGRMAMETASRS